MQIACNHTGFGSGSMTVTEIEPVKRNVMRIYLNDEPAMRLTTAEISSLFLEKDMVITAEQYDRICSLVLLKKAKIRCLDILTARDKTEKELLRILLNEDYPSHVAQDAILYVKGFHYIDDERYAVHYIEAKSSVSSRTKIMHALREKGIPEEIISEAFEKADVANQNELIRKLAQKKGYYDVTADDQKIMKVYQYLMRKGFSYQEIKKALQDEKYDM